MPVVGEGVVEIDEVGIVGGVPLAPVGGSRLRAAPVCPATVCVPDGQATPHRRVGVAFLMAQAEPQRGVGRQVDIHCAVEGLALGRVHVDPGVALVGLPDKPRTNGAFRVQCRGHIGLDAIGVPCAGAQFYRTLQVRAVGTLAHHVEGCGRITGTGHQTVGATDHFDAVVHGQAAEDFSRTPRLLIDGGYTVDHQRVELKATGVELCAAGLVAVDRHTRGIVDHIEDGFQVLVLNALLSDDADRLRRFPQRHAQRRGRARCVRCVRVGAFGNADLPSGGGLGDSDRTQDHRASLLGLFRRLQRGRRKGDTGCKHVHCQGQRAHCQRRARGNGDL
ncbi:hypothetical protein D3C84_352220 [compost metagenome]